MARTLLFPLAARGRSASKPAAAVKEAKAAPGIASSGRGVKDGREVAEMMKRIQKELSVESLEPRIAPMAFFSEAQIENPRTRSWTHQAIGRVTHPASSVGGE